MKTIASEEPMSPGDLARAVEERDRSLTVTPQGNIKRSYKSPFKRDEGLDIIHRACLMESSVMALGRAQQQNMMLALYSYQKRVGPEAFGRWLRGQSGPVDDWKNPAQQ